MAKTIIRYRLVGQNMKEIMSYGTKEDTIGRITITKSHPNGVWEWMHNGKWSIYCKSHLKELMESLKSHSLVSFTDGDDIHLQFAYFSVFDDYLKRCSVENWEQFKKSIILWQTFLFLCVIIVVLNTIRRFLYYVIRT